MNIHASFDVKLKYVPVVKLKENSKMCDKNIQINKLNQDGGQLGIPNLWIPGIQR